jgi:hypothetical protein
VTDLETKTEYVVLKVEICERMRRLFEDYDDGPWSDDERDLLAAEAGKMLDRYNAKN